MESFGVGLPAVPITDLDLNAANGEEYLYTGTYGRSIYKIFIGLLQTDNFEASTILVFSLIRQMI